MTTLPEIHDLLATYPPKIQDIALGLRHKVRAWLPDATEAVDAPDRLIGYGFGPGYRDLICTILLSKKAVSLGISHSASLPDPDGLLEGSGKVHRRVIFKGPADLDRPGVKDLLLAAVAAWKQRTGN